MIPSTQAMYGNPGSPAMTFNYLAPNGGRAVIPGNPQNLMRPTNKGCGPHCTDCGPCREKNMNQGALYGIGSLQAYSPGTIKGLYENGMISPGWMMFYGVLSVAGGALSAYHGYKRNDSVGWAIGWGLLGAWFPIITVPVALAQGYGKRA